MSWLRCSPHEERPPAAQERRAPQLTMPLKLWPGTGIFVPTGAPGKNVKQPPHPVQLPPEVEALLNGAQTAPPQMAPPPPVFMAPPPVFSAEAKSASPDVEDSMYDAMNDKPLWMVAGDEIAKLKQHLQGPTDFYWTVYRGDYDEMQSMLESERAIEYIKGTPEYRPIVAAVAAKEKSVEIIDHLLQNYSRLDINASQTSLKTPLGGNSVYKSALQTAIWNRNFTVIPALCAYYAKEPNDLKRFHRSLFVTGDEMIKAVRQGITDKPLERFVGKYTSNVLRSNYKASLKNRIAQLEMNSRHMGGECMSNLRGEMGTLRRRIQILRREKAILPTVLQKVCTLISERSEQKEQDLSFMYETMVPYVRRHWKHSVHTNPELSTEAQYDKFIRAIQARLDMAKLNKGYYAQRKMPDKLVRAEQHIRELEAQLYRYQMKKTMKELNYYHRKVEWLQTVPKGFLQPRKDFSSQRLDEYIFAKVRIKILTDEVAELKRNPPPPSS